MDETDAGAGGGPKGSPPPPLEEEDSILAGVERLFESGKELADAEFDWARLKARSLGVIARRGLRWSIVSVVCLTVALALLLVAGVVALIPVVGLLGATLIVSAVAFLGTAIAGLRARRAFADLLDGDEA